MKKLMLLLVTILIIGLLSDERILLAEQAKANTMQVEGSAAANSVGKVSYLLQVTSDLECEQLDIELVSTSGTTKVLSYTTSAFAAIDLLAGKYTYGDMRCSHDGQTESFSILADSIEAVSLNSGSHYYGGRLIFTKQKALDANANPEVLDNCPEVISRARGEATNECRDGIGVDTRAVQASQINVFAPEVSDGELAKIRNALSVTASQLLYVPLKLKSSS